MEPPFTGDFLFTRDGYYFQLIKKYSARDKYFYPPFILVMVHLLLLLEYGTSLLPLTLQPMAFMYNHATDSYLKQIIQKDSVLEMTQTRPNKTSLKIITMLSEWGKNMYAALSNEKYPPRTVILRSSSSGTTNHLDIKLYIT